MKTIQKIIIFITCLLFVNLGFSQKKVHHGHVHKGNPHKHAVVKKSHHHYSRKKVVVVRPRKVRTFGVLPAGHTTIVFRGTNHYCHTGRFYRKHLNNYLLIAPPIGIRVTVLPIGYRRIMIGTRPCFYYQGVYYAKQDNEYEVIEPSTGAMVPDLPEDLTEEVTIDGKTYYEYDNYLYKLVQTKEGPMYEVVSKLDD